MPDDIVAAIDGALHDYELVSDDAMRWSPDPEQIMVEEDYLERDRGDLLDRAESAFENSVGSWTTPPAVRILDRVRLREISLDAGPSLIDGLTRDSFRGFRAIAANPPVWTVVDEIGHRRSPVLLPRMLLLPPRDYLEAPPPAELALIPSPAAVVVHFEVDATPILRALARAVADVLRIGSMLSAMLKQAARRPTMPAVERTVSARRRAGSRRTKRLTRHW